MPQDRRRYLTLRVWSGGDNHLPCSGTHLLLSPANRRFRTLNACAVDKCANDRSTVDATFVHNWFSRCRFYCSLRSWEHQCSGGNTHSNRWRDSVRPRQPYIGNELATRIASDGCSSY